jgi:ribosomal protein S12 methylthiotransferase accessory factor
MEMSGEAAADFVRDALSSLAEPQTFDDIAARLPGYRPDSIRQQLDALVEVGVLVEHEALDDGAPPRNRPFRDLLDEIGLGAVATAGRLAAQRVAVFGLEAHGAHLAAMLAHAGIGTLALVDPYPFEADHSALTQVAVPAGGGSRQEAVAAGIRCDGLTLELPAKGGTVDRALVAEVVAGADLVVVCWDRAMSAASHWANEAALATGTPTLFSELRATSAFAGPFVFPGRSACLMCYRMRSLACEADFESAMAYEEYLDRLRFPALVRRPVLPILPSQLASVLGLEILRYLIRLNQPRLVDRVLEFDALQLETHAHPVLVEARCPVCGKKNSAAIPTALSSATSGPAPFQSRTSPPGW